MTSAFSSAESAAIERTIEDNATNNPRQLEDIWTPARLDECSAWITKHAYQRVCLQFPDELLPFSVHIAADLKTECRRQRTTNDSVVDVYILGDTSYGSCCVDEVAASHINADAILHFGHACLSRVTRLPLLYVFYSYQLDATRFASALDAITSENELMVVFYNVGYYYELDNLRTAIAAAGSRNVQFAQLALHSEADNLCWTLAGRDLADVRCVYIGSDDQTFFNTTLSVTTRDWHLYDPCTAADSLQPRTAATSSWMRRRNFYIEKCKDARSLGIVVGTLATRGYLDIVKHLQALARHRNIRTYLISVGKVNPAKLANFMEIDCFVLIGCAENDLFTSRDFYKPLLSVYEVEMALNAAWHGELAPNYSLVFGDVLPEGRLYRPFAEAEVRESDVSLVSGRLRGVQVQDDKEEQEAKDSKAVLLKRNHQLIGVVANGALQNRSWTGLDPALGRSEAVRIEQGRSGIALRYEENLAHE